MEADAGHVPVLKDEVVELLCQQRHERPKLVMDCTLGLGGHARAILEYAGKEARMIGMDADKDNVIFSQKNLASFGGQVRFFHSNFSQAIDVLEAAELDSVDTLIADLGFSSSQIDNAACGMSFRDDLNGPLDMRFDREEGQTAADIVNKYERDDLANLIYKYGEERLSRRVAAAIVKARESEYIDTTTKLAEVILSAFPRNAIRGRNRIHPATRTFQALRIAVNDELGSLETLLEALPKLLSNGGRAGIISFHSLEDRMVKKAFRHLSETGVARILTKKPVTAGDKEISENSRSRSAKLRAIEIV